VSLKVFKYLKNLVFSYEEVNSLKALVEFLHGQVRVEGLAELVLRDVKGLNKLRKPLIHIFFAYQVKRLRV
jgi:hypothetical protein